VSIPLRYRLNGRTVAQEETASLTDWHLQLPRHAVLLAEGLPAESYLDTGNNSFFAMAACRAHDEGDAASGLFRTLGGTSRRRKWTC
jgi:serralysin